MGHLTPAGHHPSLHSVAPEPASPQLVTSIGVGKEANSPLILGLESTFLYCNRSASLTTQSIQSGQQCLGDAAVAACSAVSVPTYFHPSV